MNIQAKVNPRLLSKAHRLFNGSLDGRITEILQNARRAGATRVEITNADGAVSIHDNGRGVSEFSKLLDMGASGWDGQLEESEDPSGVGLFCLAPRETSIRSNGRMLTIVDRGWTGDPVNVVDDPQPAAGTQLRFLDKPWTFQQVERQAVFSGLEVVVDGLICAQEPFLNGHAVHYPELGCCIEVREKSDLGLWHRALQNHPNAENALVNFHGQVVSLGYYPVNGPPLYFLVDLTGEPTPIRLMLPARTCLVENQGLSNLKRALEREAFLFYQRRGHHQLSYAEFVRAKAIGIELPEATPTFAVGLLEGEGPNPVEVVMPKDFPLSSCYRVAEQVRLMEGDYDNIHLLAALGTFSEPFVPVEIPGRYYGYSWAKLPTINKVELEYGDLLAESSLWQGRIKYMESIRLTVRCSDGKVFSSAVLMAINPPQNGARDESDLLVAPGFREQLSSEEIWFHVGGYLEDGDTYETQLDQFEDDLYHFWLQLVGPDESLRLRIFAVLDLIPGWKQVLASSEGEVLIEMEFGEPKLLQAPVTIFKGGDSKCDVPPVRNESVVAAGV